MIKESKYDMWVTGRDGDGIPRTIKIDWYALIENKEMSEPVRHTMKKGMNMGERSGGKDYEHDLDDMIWSLNREKAQIQMHREIAFRELKNEK